MPAVHITSPDEAVPQGAKKAFIKNYGCQMNVYDGARLADLLAPLGYTVTETADAADLVVLNTCHIRDKADQKVFSDLGRFRRQAAPDAILAVGGCTGQAMGATLMQQAPAVSIVFGPQTYHRLPALLDKIHHGRALRKSGHPHAPIRAVDTDFPELEKFDHLPLPGRSYNGRGPTAFIAIQEGCDKFCTYCVVPYTRGAEICRPAASILTEALNLAAQGVREITLIGQNVNAYADPQNPTHGLAALLDQIGALDGIARLRFTTSHPMNTTPDLLDAFATNPKLMPYFHLPVQAGSDRILRLMNRSHTVASYLDTLRLAREKRPDIAISGDFIVGFPGETEADFEQTLALAHQVQYVGAFSFAYSPRPGTPAADLPDPVDEMVKKERLAALNVILDASTAAFCQRFIGQTLEVLVDEPGGKGAGSMGSIVPQLRGKSPHNLPVNFNIPPDTDPATLIGQLVSVTITHAGAKSLTGTLTA